MIFKVKPSIYLIMIFCVVFSKHGLSTIPESELQGKRLLNTIISVDFDHVSLAEALDTIAEKSKVKINYNRDRLPEDKRVTLKKEKDYAYEILSQILENSGLALNITTGGQIVIVARKDKNPAGILKGRVVDQDTKRVLIGVNVIIKNTVLGAATDMDGLFIIPGIPVGNYTIEFSAIGYRPFIKTDVIVKSNRITTLSVELKETVINLQGVSIHGGYFTKSDENPTSTVSFSGEEVRRAPGSSGDISRVLRGLASVAKVNEQDNGLIVRGGNPMENGFYIDDIEVPNINHFPIQGTTSGPVGLVNVEFIKDVQFSAGGFSAAYGDKLSSITNIQFREGNHDAFDAQFDLSLIGAGLTAEGPFPNRKGSYLVSIRRSYLDLLAEASGMWSVPRYSDYQGKIVYQLSPKHKLSLLTLNGFDSIEYDKEDVEDLGSPIYEKFKISNSTIGLGLRSLWNEKGYSKTTLSLSSTNWDSDSWDYDTEKLLLKNRSNEQTIAFRNMNYYRLNTWLKFECGFDERFITDDYNNQFGDYTNAFGDETPALMLNQTISAYKTGVFANVIYQPFQKITTTGGLRYDRFSYNGQSNVSPRFSFTYALNVRTKINGAVGWYYQTLPLTLLAQKEAFKDLSNPASNHVVLGLEHLLTENTRLTLEIYQKNYSQLPVDPKEPSLLIFDELYNRYSYSYFFIHDQILDKGKAYCRGLELVAQKKLATQIYGTASFAWFKTQYKGYDGIWRDRVFDNRFIIGIDGGYKPNKNWEFSIRWNYAGGIPCTPLDVALSSEINRAVYDQTKVNEARLPDIHSLNLRVDRRFHFRKTNLILYYVMYNVYNRKNIRLKENQIS